ncbi:hypothetical protein DIPPA_35040, partial [Diplonema papillatum]
MLDQVPSICPAAESPLRDVEPDLPKIVEAYRERFEDAHANGCAVCGTWLVQDVCECRLETYPQLKVVSPYYTQYAAILHVVSRGDTSWHLDPEYVDLAAGTFTVCTSCHRGLKKEQGHGVPSCSFAAGTDFGRGDLADMGLPPLSVVERMLIARTVLYSTILKIRLPHDGVPTYFGGSAVSFAHSGPEELVRLPRTDTLETVTILFVGPPPIKSTKIGLRKLCEVRPKLVFQWLHFLKKHNQKYADIEIVEDAATESDLEQLPQLLVDGLVCADDPASIRIDAAAGASNQQPDDETGDHHHGIESVLIDQPGLRNAAQDILKESQVIVEHAERAAAAAAARRRRRCGPTPAYGAPDGAPDGRRRRPGSAAAAA